jgi:hypothetical protein
MKITKIVSVIAIVGILVVGTAFAATDEDSFLNRWNRRDIEYDDSQYGYGYHHMRDLSGLTDEEIEQYRSENYPYGETMIDYLKEQGLYEDWKENMLENFEFRLGYQVENNYLTQEEADELLQDYEQRIEEGPPYFFGNMSRGARGFNRNFRNFCGR